MRRGMLTVPPAPGTRPSPISGSEITLSGCGDDPPGERRQLDAGAHARAVEVDFDTVADGRHQPRRAAREADEVR